MNIWIFEYLCSSLSKPIAVVFKGPVFYFLDQAGPASIDFWLITCYVIPTSPLPTIHTRLSQLIWVFRKVCWAPPHRWKPVEDLGRVTVERIFTPSEVSCVTCHMSHAMCSVSVVMCNGFCFAFCRWSVVGSW